MIKVVKEQPNSFYRNYDVWGISNQSSIEIAITNHITDEKYKNALMLNLEYRLKLAYESGMNHYLDR